MKAVSIAALVIAVIALGVGLVALVRTQNTEYENARIFREVEALGGWNGEFIVVEEGTLETGIPFGAVTDDGYQLFGGYSDRERAEQFVKSLANIKEYGIMILQPEDDRWLVYREFSS